MSGKKLRQRAFAWFMAIAMVLTNITISPLTSLVARAAEISTVSIKTNWNGNSGDQLSVGKKLSDITFAPVAGQVGTITVDSAVWYEGEASAVTAGSTPLSGDTLIKGNATYTVMLQVARAGDNEFPDGLAASTVKLYSDDSSALQYDSSDIEAKSVSRDSDVKVAQRTITFELKTDTKAVSAVKLVAPGFAKGATVADATASVALAENELGYSVSQNGIYWYEGDSDDAMATTATFKAATEYTVEVKLVDNRADGYEFDGSDASWSGTAEVKFGDAESATPASEKKLTVETNMKGLTIKASATTSKDVFAAEAPAYVELKGLENKAEVAATSIGYPADTSGAEKAKYTISNKKWFAKTAFTLDTATNVIAVNSAPTAKTDPFIGGTEYWLAFKIGAASESYEVTKNSQIKVKVGENEYDAYFIGDGNVTVDSTAVNFAALITCPADALESAVLRLVDTAVEKIKTGATIADTIGSTVTDVVKAVATVDKADTATISQITINNAVIAPEKGSGDKYTLDTTYKMTIELTVESALTSGVAIADSFKDNVILQLGTNKAASSSVPAVTAPTYKAVFSHMNDARYVFVASGIPAKDVRALESVVEDDAGGSTLDSWTSLTQGTTATKKVKATLADATLAKYYEDDVVTWEIVPPTGGKADGITIIGDDYNSKATAKMTATVEISETAAPGNYKIKAILNGDKDNAVESAQFTIAAAAATAEIVADANIYTVGTESQTVTFSIDNFKFADAVSRTQQITWALKAANGIGEPQSGHNLTYEANGDGTGEKSWTVTMTIPTTAKAGEYAMTATTAGSDLEIKPFRFDVVASDKKAKVTSVAIKAADGGAFAETWISKGDTLVLKAVPTTLDDSAVKYLWKVTSGTAANLTLSGETTDTLTITGKDLGEDFKVTVYASNNDVLTAENAESKKEAYLASSVIHVVQYNMGVAEITAAANYFDTAVAANTKISASNVLNLSYGRAKLTDNKTVTFNLYNGNDSATALTADADKAKWEILSGNTKLGKDTDQVSISPSGESKDTSATLTLNSGNVLQSPQQYKIKATLNGIEIIGTIEISYDWKEVKVIDVKHDTKAIPASNEYYVTKANATSGIILTATGKNTATVDAYAPVTYTWAKVDAKDEDFTLTSSTSTATFTTSKLGSYQIKVTAKNDDNDAKGAGDTSATDKTPFRIITINVVDYLNAVDGVISDKVDEVMPEGLSKDYQFSVMNNLEDGPEAVEAQATWAISAMTPAENSTGDKIYTIDAKTGALTINANNDPKKDTNKSWTVTVKATVNGIETAGTVVTLYKDAQYVTAVNAPSVAYGDSKKDSTVYVLGISGAEGDYLRLVGSVKEPANATNKEVTFVVIEKATPAKEVKKENIVTDAIEITAVEGLQNTYDLKGLKRGSYYIYAYSSYGKQAAPDVFSADADKIEVKVVDYRLYEKDAEAPTDATKDVEVAKSGDAYTVNMAVESSKQFVVKTLVPAAKEEDPDKAERLTATIAPVVETKEEGGVNYGEYVNVAGDTVTVKKFTDKPIKMTATVHGQVIKFNIIAEPTDFGFSLNAYAGDQKSSEITADTKAYVSGTDLNLNGGTADDYTVSLVANVTSGKEGGSLVEANRTVSVSYAVVNSDGTEVALENAREVAKVAEVTRVNDVPVSDGKGGYNTMYVVTLKEPVDLKVTVTADGNASKTDEIVISGSQLAIYEIIDGEYAKVNAAVEMTSTGIDAPEFVAINGKADAVKNEDGTVEIKAQNGQKPEAGVVWTVDAKAFDKSEDGGKLTLTLNNKRSLTAKTYPVKAKVGEIEVAIDVKVAKYVPVKSVAITNGNQKVSKGSTITLNVEVKGEDGVPTMIDYKDFVIRTVTGATTSVVAGDIVPETDAAGSYTISVRAVKATEEGKPAEVTVESGFGMNAAGELEPVVDAITIDISDLSVVYGEDETPLEGESLDVVPGEPVIIKIIDNKTGKAKELQPTDFTFDPAGSAEYVDGQIKVKEGYENKEIKVTANVGGVDVMFTLTPDPDAVSSIYLLKNDVKVAGNKGRYTIDLAKSEGATYKLSGGSDYVSSDKSVATVAGDVVTPVAEGVTEIKSGSKSIVLVVTNSQSESASLAPDKITINPAREFMPEEGIYDPAASMYLNYNGSGVVEDVKVVNVKKGTHLPLDWEIVDNTADPSQSILAMGFRDPVAQKLSGGKYLVQVTLSTGRTVSAEVNVKISNSPVKVTGKQITRYNNLYNQAQFMFTNNKNENVESILLGGEEVYDAETGSVTLYGKDAQASSLVFSVKVSNYRDRVNVTMKNRIIAAGKVRFSKSTIKVLASVDNQVVVPLSLKAEGETIVPSDEAEIANSNGTITGTVNTEGNIVLTINDAAAIGQQYITITDPTYAGEVNVKLDVKAVALDKASTKLSKNQLTLIGSADSAQAHTKVTIGGTDVVAQGVMVNGEVSEAFNAETGILTVSDAGEYLVQAFVGEEVVVGKRAVTLKAAPVTDILKAAKVSVKGNLDVIARASTYATITVTIPGIDATAADLYISDLGDVPGNRVALIGEEGLMSGKGNTFTAYVGLKVYESEDDDFSKEEVKSGIVIAPTFTIQPKDGSNAVEFKGPQAKIKLSAVNPKLNVVLDPVDKTFTYRKDGRKELTITGKSNKMYEPMSAQEINKVHPEFKGNADLKVTDEGEAFYLNYTRKGTTLPKKSYNVPLNVKFEGYKETFKTSVKIYIAP